MAADGHTSRRVEARQKRTKADVTTTALRAAMRLREIIFEHEDGAYLGSQTEMMERLGVTRATLQQTARLLEQEQLLRVKRGNSGGYYGRRPDVGAVEKAVATYMRSRRSGYPDVLQLANALTSEIVRLAALSDNEAARAALLELAGIEDPQTQVESKALTAAEARLFKALFVLADSPLAELMLRVTARIYWYDPPIGMFARPEGPHLWQWSRLNIIRAVLLRDPEYAQLIVRHFFRGLEDRLAAMRRDEDAKAGGPPPGTRARKS